MRDAAGEGGCDVVAGMRVASCGLFEG